MSDLYQVKWPQVIIRLKLPAIDLKMPALKATKLSVVIVKHSSGESFLWEQDFKEQRAGVWTKARLVWLKDT